MLPDALLMAGYAHSFTVPTTQSTAFDRVFSFPQDSYIVDFDININCTGTVVTRWGLYLCDNDDATAANVEQGLPVVSGGTLDTSGVKILMVFDNCFGDIGRNYVIRRGAFSIGERRHLVLAFGQSSALLRSLVLVSGRYYAPSTIKKLVEIDRGSRPGGGTVLDQIRREAQP